MTIGMRNAEGREWVPNLTQPNNPSKYYYYRLVKNLALKSYILLGNFKLGALRKWGLGLPSLRPYNPFLIFTCVSGYGQKVVRPNMSLGDSIARPYAAFGTVLARGRRVVDISIMERYLSPLYII